MAAPGEEPRLSLRFAAFERAFDELNAAYFDGRLDRPVITVSPTPSAYGHFTPWRSWASGEDAFHEINLGAETIGRPVAEVMATLLHEMVHLHCHEQGIKDTSRGGTYHNGRFRIEAEKRGLVIAYDKRIGWSLTSPGDSLLLMARQGAFKKVEGELRELHRLGRPAAASAAKRPSSTRKYTCPRCGMSVRATRAVRVKCVECDEELTCDLP